MPPAAAPRRSHTRGYRSTFAVPTSSAITRTSEHFHVFSPPPALECSDVRLGGQETRKRVLELRCPVTVPREICSLGRMNDDRTDLEIFQHTVLATIGMPFRLRPSSYRGSQGDAFASPRLFLSRRSYRTSARIIGCFEADRALGAVSLAFADVPECGHAYIAHA